MSRLSKGSYQNYRNCNVGDTAIIYAYDPESKEKFEYQGTVVDTPGATVKVQSSSGRMLEMRSVEENDTGDMAILLAIDGKEVSETKEKTGVNPSGKPIKSESTKLSFDYRVTEFEAESQELYIGSTDED